MDALRRIVRALRISARAAEARLGISGAQLFVLHELGGGDAPSIDALAARTHTHQSSVSLVVSRLASRGLVVRRADPHDARRTTIALTAAGRALLQQAPEVGQARLIAALERLGPAQRRNLASHLASLVHALDVDSERPAMFFEEDATGMPKRARRQTAVARHSRTG